MLLSQLTGHEEWDGVGSVGVGVLLACAAFIVGYETKSLLIGESASEETAAQIVSAHRGRAGGVPADPPADVAHRPGQPAGRRRRSACPAELTAAELTAGIDAVEKRIRAAVPIAETIYLEPDIYRPGQEDPRDPSVAIVQRTTRRFRPRTPRRS